MPEQVTQKAELKAELTPRQRSLANLRPFKPGEARIPRNNGRPKDPPIIRELKRALEGKLVVNGEEKTKLRCLAEAMVNHAIKGNAQFGIELLNRFAGKCPDLLDIRSQSLCIDIQLDGVYDSTRPDGMPVDIPIIPRPNESPTS